MSWNGSDQTSSTAREGTRRTDFPRGRNPSTVHLLSRPIFYLLLLALGVAALLWLGRGRSPSAPPPTDASKHHAQIASVAPQIVTNRPAAEPAPPKPKPIDPNARPTVVGEILNGYKLLPNGRLHKVYGVYTTKVDKASWPLSIFENTADQQIAELMIIEPGNAVVGDGSLYYEDFEEDFREALKKEIAFSPKDTDVERALKQSVIETRNDLKARMDAGEKIVDIMREAHDQMREIGLYHDELHQQVEEIAQDTDKEFTEKDIKELVKAANTMLEERGSKPLAITGPMVYQMRIDYLEQRKAELEKKLEEEK